MTGSGVCCGSFIKINYFEEIKTLNNTVQKAEWLGLSYTEVKHTI